MLQMKFLPNMMMLRDLKKRLDQRCLFVIYCTVHSFLLPLTLTPETRCGISSQVSYIYPFDPTTVGRSGRLIATVLRYFNYHFDTWAAMHIHIITRYVQKFSCGISHHIITGGGSMCKVLKSRCYSFLTTFHLCSIHWLHQHHGFIREEQWNTVSRWWLYRIARSNVLKFVTTNHWEITAFLAATSRGKWHGEHSVNTRLLTSDWVRDRGKN